jgi:NAD(P)-dependent dehydrogenase (short-subunit alcohol dehydrogenase family)
VFPDIASSCRIQRSDQKRLSSQASAKASATARRKIEGRFHLLYLEFPASQVSKVFTVTRNDDCPILNDFVAQYPDRAFHIVASVDDTQSVQQAASEVKSKLGSEGLDVLVNNAGIQSFAPGGTKTVPPEQLE